MLFFENFWWLLVLIGVMILIHELGHYWAARFFDVRVETFSFGFGPRLFGFRKGETDFRFSAILFGGYVKMAGEQPGEENPDDPRSFLSKPRWQRLIIAFAGPLMNILLAIGLLTGLFMFKYPRVAGQDGPAVVGHVAAGSPAAQSGVREGDRIAQIEDLRNPTWEDVFLREVASAKRELPVFIDRNGEQIRMLITPALDERNGVGFVGWSAQNDILLASVASGMGAEKAGLKPGDVLVRVNGEPVRSVLKLHEIIRRGEGKPVEVTYRRDGKEATIQVQPTLGDLNGKQQWMIGVGLEPRVTYVRLPFGEALRESINQNQKGATLIFRALEGILERRLSAKTLEGPVGIARLSGDAAREGPAAFIGLMAMVSLNLAIFNLLPIPVLDGGVILLLLVEMLMRRNLSLQVKEAFYKVGFVFLMMLMVFVLYNDISKMLPG
jgi:regulator of sigma E protease